MTSSAPASPPKVAPSQLALRFLLEVVALYAIGAFASHQVSSWSVLAGLGAASLAALFWVTFAVRGDPSRSGNAPVPVPGPVRLALELCIFGAGVFALVSLQGWPVAAVDGGLIVVHHAMTLPRLSWLVRQ